MLTRTAPAAHLSRSRVAVGALVSTPVPMTTGERLASAVAGVAGGLFAYALFTGHPAMFSSRHPVWGYLFGAGAVGSIGYALAGTKPELIDDGKKA